MSGKRKNYTPAYRREAAHLVIDTSRPIAHVAKEIGVGEQLLGRWVAQERAKQADPPEALMLMSGLSWPGFGPRTPSYGWTGSS